jgi:hypothetical protein
LCGDALIKAVADIILVILRIEAGSAPEHLAAIANSGAMRPIEAGCGFEFIGDLMVHAEHSFFLSRLQKICVSQI